MINKQKITLPRLIAHRGAGLLAPENTLESLALAIDLGAKYVEFDVSLTKTGECVVFHDDALDRTTNGTGIVEQASLAEIRQLDAGSWFSTKYAQAKVPLLTQWLELAAKHRCGLNLEIKSTTRVTEVVNKVLTAIDDCWNDALPSILISSKSTAILEELYAIDQRFNYAWISDDWSDDWQEVLNRYNCYSWHVDYRILTESRIKSVLDTKYKLLAYTVNDKPTAVKLLAAGLSCIYTDDVLLLS